jgi:biopolymer transport protein ExbB/TolQ
MALLVIAGMVAWWLVLAHKSRQVAQEESNRQTHLLMREIESHRQTDEALQQAKQAAEQAKPRPTRPRAATSAPSATSCARRSTASWVMRS